MPILVLTNRQKTILRLFVPLISTLIIIGGTLIAVQLGKGYRPTKDGILKGTGLLAATSFPKGASVYINDQLITATDDTLNFPPGEYQVRIQKDGYIPWEKLLKVEEELVTSTNATLFPTVPSLSPLTLTGATNPVPSPDGQKILYTVASSSAQTKNGLYMIELQDAALPFQKGAKQIAISSKGHDLSNAHFLWSPDSSQVLIHFEPTDTRRESNYIVDINKLNDLETAADVTLRLPIILGEWEEDIANRETKQFALLPGEMQRIATMSATNVFFSPNDEKVMYTATQYVTIPENLAPQLPASNTQPEERSIEPGGIYIYDLKEDKNFRISSTEVNEDGSLASSINKQLLLLSDYQQSIDSVASKSGTLADLTSTDFTKLQISENTISTLNNFSAHYSSIFINNLQWFPDSSHILMKFPKEIKISEYDSTNLSTLYAGPFENNFVYPWPDGSKLIILINLNSTTTYPNLYTVSLR